MDNIKNDAYYLRKIAIDIEFILEHTKEITEEELEANEVLMDSVRSMASISTRGTIQSRTNNPEKSSAF